MIGLNKILSSWMSVLQTYIIHMFTCMNRWRNEHVGRRILQRSQQTYMWVHWTTPLILGKECFPSFECYLSHSLVHAQGKRNHFWMCNLIFEHTDREGANSRWGERKNCYGWPIVRYVLSISSCNCSCSCHHHNGNLNAESWIAWVHTLWCWLTAIMMSLSWSSTGRISSSWPFGGSADNEFDQEVFIHCG